MDEKGSIFDYAGGESKKKISESENKKSETINPQSVGKASPEEIREMFKKVYQLNDSVAKKLDDAYKLLGQSKDDIKNFLDNSNNFSNNEQWQIIQKAREDKLSKVEKEILYLGEEIPSKDERKKEKKKKEDSEAEKKRKGKTLGSRKGWLSM